MRSLMWFRRDLRIDDNPALTAATKAANEGVVAVFLLADKQWMEHEDAPAKVQFWLENLRELSASLQKINIPLLVVKCSKFSDAAKTLIRIAKKHDCKKLFFNREYEVNENRRDAKVSRACKAASIETQEFHDRVMVPPEEIKTAEGKFYSVYSPYRRTWEKKATGFLEFSSRPRKQKPLEIESSNIPKTLSGFSFSGSRMDLWPAGEKEAKRRLKNFADSIAAYDVNRDLPALNGTSLLSPYLAAGVISPRQCLSAAMTCNRGKTGGDGGAATWISELAWRDFYTQVMVGCPRVSMNRPFKLKTESISWNSSDDDFEAWAEGRTGYPLVDAGMRQLNQTGWMHNRLRMVTAMFLTKHLLVDWRKGESYFMQRLIDGDLAANNGGWQWSASTGTDAVPYFRIFNPFSQSKRFDAEGEFIKKYCPELADVPARELHDAKKLAAAIERLQIDYPSFCVDYSFGRERALAAFKKLADR